MRVLVRDVRAVRAGVAIAAIVAAALGTAACDAILDEKERYLAPDDAAPTSDAGGSLRDAADASDASVIAPPDAAASGDAGDAAGDDGGGDASDAGTDAGPFCASGPPHYICSDFDEGALYYDFSDAGGQWIPSLYGAGDLSIMTPSTIGPLSPPGSLRSAFDGAEGGTTGTGSSAALQLTLPNDVTSLQLDLDVLAPTQTTDQGVVNLISLVQTDTGANAYGTWVEVTSLGLALVNFVSTGGSTQTANRALPQLGSGWQHVRLVMQRAASGHITLSFGATVVVDQDLDTLSADTQDFALRVGLNSAESSSLLQAYYDNVTFDFSE